MRFKSPALPSSSSALRRRVACRQWVLPGVVLSPRIGYLTPSSSCNPSRVVTGGLRTATSFSLRFTPAARRLCAPDAEMSSSFSLHSSLAASTLRQRAVAHEVVLERWIHNSHHCQPTRGFPAAVDHPVRHCPFHPWYFLFAANVGLIRQSPA